MAAAKLDPNTMKVLIAEDAESVRFALRMAVQYLGHEVVGLAIDGQDAFDQIDNVHPDLVLMDVRMPGMDGLTCTALVTQRDLKPKIIIVTAGRTPEEQALKAGARGFVEKPFELGHLRRLLLEMAGRIAGSLQLCARLTG